MKYTNYVKHYFYGQEGSSQNCLLFMGNGSTIYKDDYTTQNYPTFSQVVSYFNSQTSEEIAMMLYQNKENHYNLIVNNKVDFVYFENVGISSSTIHVVMCKYVLANSSELILEDGNMYYGYLNRGYDSQELFNTEEYGAYEYTLNGGYKSIYDFTQTQSGTNFRNDSVIVASNDAYYYNAFDISGDISNLKIGYGTPFYDNYEDGVTFGTNNGYRNGYQVGYNDGYIVGSTTGGVDANTYNAFGYIAQTFNAIGGIMEIEVLPHVSLGLCFSIPFVLVMIMVIFKMVKK